jgi:hypothetical protein
MTQERDRLQLLDVRKQVALPSCRRHGAGTESGNETEKNGEALSLSDD